MVAGRHALLNAPGRRRFLQGAGVAGLGLLAGCGRLPWQPSPPPRVPRVGFLSFLAEGGGNADTIPRALQDYGYAEGQSIQIEWRFANLDSDRLADLAAELVRLPVDLIPAEGIAIGAARDATTTIPIVMAGAIDPVAAGYVTSLARPGGNITGFSSIAPMLSGKRLELLRETVPAASRVSVLWRRP